MAAPRPGPWRWVLAALAALVLAFALGRLMSLRQPGTAVVESPPDAYVGTWQGDGVTLVVGDDGHLKYTGPDLEIEAPIEAITADAIEVKALGFERSWAIDSPPVRRRGTWTMTVDGTVLERVDP